MKWSAQKSFVDAVRFRPGHDEYTPLGSSWTAESDMSPVQSWMKHSCLFPDATLACWPLTKNATTFVKAIHCFKYFFCHNDSFIVSAATTCELPLSRISSVYHYTTLSSHHKWYSDHKERLACSALIHQHSPSSNELKGSFHTNCFFRIIIPAINCKEALVVYREIRPNEINTRSLLIQICSASQQKTCWRLDREKARKFESIFPIRDADA